MKLRTTLRATGLVAFAAASVMSLAGTASAATAASVQPAAVASPQDIGPPLPCEPWDPKPVDEGLYIDYWAYDHADYQYPYETLWYRHWTVNYLEQKSPWGWSECGRHI